MRAAAVVLAATMAVGAGCVLVTGSTDGYSLVDSGGAAGSSCTSAASCADAGVCCLVLTAASTSLGGTCVPSCSVALPQLCATDAECGEMGPCSTQTCTVDGGGGIPFSLRVCGVVPGCMASP
jgi:hypothetical protein